MGGSYAYVSAKQDKRIKGTALISPYMFTHLEGYKVLGGKLSARIIMAIMQPIASFLNIFNLNIFLPAWPETKFQKLTMKALPIQKASPEYYAPGAPGDFPTYKNSINIAKADKLILGKYNPLEMGKDYDKHAFFHAYADQRYSVEILQDIYDKLETAKKDIYVAKNDDHFSLYYKDEHMEIIVAKIARLFKNYRS
jgi:hypothetical protein